MRRTGTIELTVSLRRAEAPSNERYARATVCRRLERVKAPGALCAVVVLAAKRNRWDAAQARLACVPRICARCAEARRTDWLLVAHRATSA